MAVAVEVEGGVVIRVMRVMRVIRVIAGTLAIAAQPITALAAAPEGLDATSLVGPVARSDAPAAIVGGDPVADGPSAVAAVVDAGGIVRCTAIVVDPSWALTAAHCATEADDAGEPLAALWFGVDLVDGEPDLVIPITEAVVHPAYAGGRDDDLAMLALGSPAPGPVARLVVEPPQPYDPLDAYGYGVTSDGATDGGVLRAVTLDVLSVEAGVFLTYTPGANLCSGDSGGPLVVPGTAPLAVAGVAAFVDPTCLGGRGGAVRSDVAYAFAIDLAPDIVPAELGIGTGSTATPTFGSQPPTGDDDDTRGTGEDEDGEDDRAVVTRSHGCDHTCGSWLGLVAVALASACGRRSGIRRSRYAAGLPHPRG